MSAEGHPIGDMALSIGVGAQVKRWTTPTINIRVAPCISHILPRADLICIEKMATANDNQRISEGEPSGVIQSARELEATPSLPSIDSDGSVSCRIEI
jgi:hypothetical protein